MRAALYIRVSTEEQGKEGYSIESQTAVCQRWVLEKGHQLVDIYTDEGVSSKTLKRPDMQRMIRDVERRKFDVLVFWRLNRVTRTVKDKVFLFDLFDKYGVSLKSMTEEIDTTTASGRMVTNLLVSVAQGEREQTAENVHSTMRELSLDGKRQGAKAPYGYDLVDGILFVNEDQAKTVKRVFEMYGNNLAGFREIAVTLNNDVDKLDDKLWNYSTVRYVLMNPVYTGKLRWNYRKYSGHPTGNEIISVGPHEPIIEQSLFDKVNAEINKRKKGGKVATSDYAFAGILRCNRCKKAMSGFSAIKSNGRHRYYRCIGRTQYGICHMPIIKDEKLQEAFLDALDYDPKQFKKAMNVNMNKATNERQRRVDSLKKELEKIQNRKKKWQIAYANDGITLEELKDHTREDKELEETIQKELQQIPDSQAPKMSREEVIEQLALVRDLWKRSDNEKIKKAYIRDVFESITIDCETERSHGGPGNFAEVMVVDFKLRI